MRRQEINGGCVSGVDHDVPVRDADGETSKPNCTNKAVGRTIDSLALGTLGEVRENPHDVIDTLGVTEEQAPCS